MLVFGGITARLVQLQGFGAHRLSALGAGQRVHTVTLSAERGSMFDRNGIDLALSVPSDTVWADPRLVRDPAAYAAQLAPILGQDAGTLEAELAKPDTAFVYIARKVDPGVSDQIRQLDLPGIDFVPESRRHYPAGDLAAPILGFTGLDNDGLGGLEAGYEDVLAGRPGELVVERDPQGREIPSARRTYNPPERGSDLVLTIDQALQYEVEEALLAQVRDFNAAGGTAIIAEVETGDILAMANVDGAGDGQPAHRASAFTRNRAFTDVFEPGSTNKVITVAGALEEGLVTPDTTFTVGPAIDVGGEAFEEHDWHAVAGWTVADILRESSNVGTIQIAQQLGKERLDAYLRAFGLGSETAIGFPGEAPGILLDPDSYSATSIATVPMGQGLAVTPMQLLDVYLAIANGGSARDPRLVEATVGPDGKRQNEPLAPERRVVSEATAKALTTMLEDVVTAGTGRRAAIDGYTVAGKTGTAQQTAEGRPGYVAGAFDGSFAGFAPAEDPQLVALVVLDRPQPYYGGIAAAPVFSEIMRSALRTLRVPTTGSTQFAEASAGLQADAQRQAAEAAQKAQQEQAQAAAEVQAAPPATDPAAGDGARADTLTATATPSG